MKVKLLMVIVGAAAILGVALRAADESPKSSPSPDEAAVRKNVRAYVQAFEKQDAKTLAALWSPKAVYVDPDSGLRAQGREAIEAAFAAQFKKDGANKLRVNVNSLRFVSPDVAIEDGTATVTDAAGEATTSNYTAVHVRSDGAWLLDSVRETAVPAEGSAQDQLQSLEFLVGEWVDEDDQATVAAQYHWAANQSFLLHSYTAFVEDRIEIQGTQVIGWDAAAKTIRSWAFDSAGGFAEATWRQDGDRFVINSKSTLPDGKRGSAVNVLRRVNDDHCTWTSTARQIDGEMLPNIDEIDIVRREDAVEAEEAAADDAAVETEADAPLADEE